MAIRIYLNLSFKDQDVDFTKQIIEENASKNNLDLEGACYYIESNPDRKWSRPELDKLIEHSQLGDILLLEKISHLTSLKLDTWNQLKDCIDRKGLITVACDIPTSFKSLDKADDAVIESVKALMNEFLAATASQDYEERLKRQKEGIKRGSHKPVGRPSNPETSKKCESVYEAVETKSMSVAKALKKYGVSKATYYRWQAKQDRTSSVDKKVATEHDPAEQMKTSSEENVDSIFNDDEFARLLQEVEDIQNAKELPQGGIDLSLRNFKRW